MCFVVFSLTETLSLSRTTPHRTFSWIFLLPGIHRVSSITGMAQRWPAFHCLTGTCPLMPVVAYYQRKTCPLESLPFRVVFCFTNTSFNVLSLSHSVPSPLWHLSNLNWHPHTFNQVSASITLASSTLIVAYSRISCQISHSRTCVNMLTPMGVNIPAHLVVIKNMVQYQAGTTLEYASSAVLQMIDRVGRPRRSLWRIVTRRLNLNRCSVHRKYLKAI